MAEAKGRQPNGWGVFGSGLLVLGGLVVAGMSVVRLPPSREALAVAEAVAPIHVTDELVRESGGRHSSGGTWRRQNIPVAGGGRSYLVVSPPRTLWVPDIDRLAPGTVVRFLIDPDRRLVYEAKLGERVLLAYETSAGQQRRGALYALALAAGLLAMGGFGLWRGRALFAG
jgi:hypothetical protein